MQAASDFHTGSKYQICSQVNWCGLREVGNFSLLACYAADPLPLKMGPISCPETSVMNYHYCLRNNLKENSSQAFFSSIT